GRDAGCVPAPGARQPAGDGERRTGGRARAGRRGERHRARGRQRAGQHADGVPQGLYRSGRVRRLARRPRAARGGELPRGTAMGGGGAAVPAAGAWEPVDGRRETERPRAPDTVACRLDSPPGVRTWPPATSAATITTRPSPSPARWAPAPTIRSSARSMHWRRPAATATAESSD